MGAKRSSGVLLHVSSLPSPYGIGSMGKHARAFVDFLAEARQSIWQILPLSPVDETASPYMSPSAFAGNVLLLDLDDLYARGLITQQELQSQRSEKRDFVDYAQVRKQREALYQAAYARLDTIPTAAPELSDWLPDYALFMAATAYFDGADFYDWSDRALAMHEPKALAHYQKKLAKEIGYHIFLQNLFFEQWRDLKAYANAKQIRIMGDLPFYLSPHSDAVWANSALFQLDDTHHCTCVSGVPPDAFSDVGQHWGNPLYEWSAHAKDNFSWWRKRILHLSSLYDMLRIDHFRAAHSYWSIPSGETDARTGHWEEGPGMPFVAAISAAPLQLIAEDLGDLNADCLAFMANSGLPGMKVLVQAFEGGESAFLPHNCGENCVLYTTTHDTPTFMEWYLDLASEGSRAFARHYMRLTEQEGFHWGAIRAAWQSAAPIVITSMQDLLSLGADARMNTPGTLGAHNWSWRVREEAFNTTVSKPLRDLTELYFRY